MKCLLLILFLLLPVAAGAAPEMALDVMMDDDTWQKGRKEFTETYREWGLRWRAKDQSVASAIRAGHTFLGASVAETTIKFDGDVVSQIIVSPYDRGNCGHIKQAKFEAIIEKTTKSIDAWTQVRSREVKGQLQTRGVRRKCLSWKRPGSEIRLTYSFSTAASRNASGFLAEYIRVTCGKVQSGKPESRLKKKKITQSVLKSRIKQSDSGDVHIEEIPMVFQGDKGYCAVATAARVFLYYGQEADQNEIAQLAGSTPERGTVPAKLMEALRHVGVKMDCRVRDLVVIAYKDQRDILKDYNREAKRQKKPAVKHDYVWSWFELCDDMDLEIWRKVRTKDRGAYRKFETAIKQYVDQGKPLLWSMAYGKVEEGTLQQRTATGHMRLIIGYNGGKKEILYSDTWGADHELKRMALADAWTVTTGLYMIEPRKLGL